MAYIAGRAMQAWGQHVWGASPKLLERVELPAPAPGPLDVVVHVLGAATNPIDNKSREPPADHAEGASVGEMAKVVGWDAAGQVVAVGDAARRFKIGDEVYFAGDKRRDGCFAEYVAVDQRVVAHKPRSLSFAEAAAIPLTTLTAHEALVDIARVQPDGRGLSLLIVGGAGGVGSMATQLARHVLGFRHIVATASRKESREFCMAHGAHACINHREDMQAQLDGAGAKDGFDVIFDCADADSNFQDLVPLLKQRGRVIIITGIKDNVDLMPIMSKRGSVHFEIMFGRLLHDDAPEEQGRVLANVATLLDDGILKPRILDENRHSIAQLQEALEKQASGGTVGKIVLDCANWA